MEKLTFFSIIMPVYNAEKYLECAAISVLNQTYKNFELILVNDCSSDGSMAICKKLASMDSRILVLSTPYNSGASAARNLALKKARGKYLGFVDSDDTIDLKLLEKAYHFLKNGKYECLKFGCKEEYYAKDGKLKYTKICNLSEGEFEAGVALSNQIVKMETMPLFGYAWNGFYSKAIAAMHGIFFNEQLKVNEDFDFNIRFFKHVSRLKCIDYPGYHYAKRLSGSLSSQEKNYTYEVQMIKIKALLSLYPNVETISLQTKKEIFWLYTRFIYAILIRAKRENDFYKVEKKVRSDPIYAQFCQIKFCNLSWKQKMMMNSIKNIHGILFYLLIESIYALKTYFPMLFTMVKK